MFIRRTQTRSTDSGGQYYSFRLVDTYRSAGRVRQRTLLNLGSGFAVAPEQWLALTQRIPDTKGWTMKPTSLRAIANKDVRSE